ncbi:MAG: flagellar basal body P-ring formation chaperone FlgA [Planktotalea sp.]|uniref:flagellar basal body P-ring formation chaperone FlgA n=1 Tax=Planktotalea sp. TaxID=2029877 RepID=UPI003C71E3E8
MRILIALCLALFALPLRADIAVPTRNIRPGDILRDSDVMMIRGETADAFTAIADVIGLEARVALYAGRAILSAQVERAASVERNQIIELVYVGNGLSMSTEGRALGRGAEGQRIRVMNLTSKTSIFGTIQSDGTVRVTK